MKNFLIVIVTLLTVVMPNISNSSPNCFTMYKSALGFQVEVPAWDISEMMQSDIHEFICAYSKDIYIKVFKLKSIQSDILAELTWKIWDIDPNAHFVLQSRNDNGGILVATYRNKVSSIHRIRIINTGATIFIIECSAPENTFYSFESFFNRVFQSFATL
ncbi:MAG: hypothetical protein N3F66_01705 [Spirochaetes bacterium]|nr:hypothetical protein [Spirochaetota bacterium]